MSVAYERPIPMRILIDSFLVQTKPNWELTVVHDGWGSDDIWRVVELYDDMRIKYIQSEIRNQQYGHPNRKQFLIDLEAEPTDYVLLTNDDNYYVPILIDEILKVANPNIGMIYWDTVHSHFGYTVLKSIIKVDHIDIGSFVVRADIAKKVGFNNFAFNGDGYYAEECAKACIETGLSTVKINKVLFCHN